MVPSSLKLLLQDQVDVSIILFNLIFLVISKHGVSNHTKYLAMSPFVPFLVRVVSSVITFDQSLWWKALYVIKGVPEDSELHLIVL